MSAFTPIGGGRVVTLDAALPVISLTAVQRSPEEGELSTDASLPALDLVIREPILADNALALSNQSPAHVGILASKKFLNRWC